MNEEYKITAVSPQVKEWEGQYGKMKTFHVRLDKHGDTPVQLNKKLGSPEPQVGESVYGSIQRTEYGDKFKGAKKPFSGGGQPRDDMAIRAQWAIGQAVNYLNSIQDATPRTPEEFIEAWGIKFFAMVDRVKNSSPQAELPDRGKYQPEPEKPKTRDWDNLGKDRDIVETASELWPDEEN